VVHRYVPLADRYRITGRAHRPVGCLTPYQSLQVHRVNVSPSDFLKNDPLVSEISHDPTFIQEWTDPPLITSQTQECSYVQLKGGENARSHTHTHTHTPTVVVMTGLRVSYQTFNPMKSDEKKGQSRYTLSRKTTSTSTQPGLLHQEITRKRKHVLKTSFGCLADSAKTRTAL
jgi:hypothetical protein